MDNEAFSNWLSTELEKRRMTQRDLSDMISTSESHVSMVLRGKRSMTADFVLSVADALDLPRIDALSIAKVVSPQPKPDDPQLQRVYWLLSQLSEAERGFVLRMLEGLARRTAPPGE